jgi:hypothetical protein
MKTTIVSKITKVISINFELTKVESSSIKRDILQLLLCYLVRNKNVIYLIVIKYYKGRGEEERRGRKELRRRRRCIKEEERRRRSIKRRRMREE